MAKKTTRLGRPPGRKFQTHLHQLIDGETDAAISLLAEHWVCSRSAAVRRALLEASERVKSPEAGTVEAARQVLLEAAKKLK